MDNTSSALLQIRFAPHLSRKETLGALPTSVNALPSCEKSLPYLEEVPDWAPRRTAPSSVSVKTDGATSSCFTANSVDHYESWQGICW